MATVLAHLLAVYVILAAPPLSRYWYQKARERVRAGAADAKLRLYRGLVLEQIVSTLVVLALLAAGVAAPALGLTMPRALPWNIAALVVIGGALVWSGLKLRRRAGEIKEKLRNGIGILVPDTKKERPWFGAVSVGAGISEELAFRGFLFYYFSIYLPHINVVEKVFLAGLIFGLGHLYQGWKGIVGTGILGLVFGGLYVITGSLLLPMVLHAMVDLRVLLIFPPDTTDEEPVAELA
jgi:uncharacterized protein